MPTQPSAIRNYTWPPMRCTPRRTQTRQTLDLGPVREPGVAPTWMCELVFPQRTEPRQPLAWTTAPW